MSVKSPVSISIRSEPCIAIGLIAKRRQLKRAISLLFRLYLKISFAKKYTKNTVTIKENIPNNLANWALLPKNLNVKDRTYKGRLFKIGLFFILMIIGTIIDVVVIPISLLGLFLSKNLK